ncbi:MAG: efflux RND transporter permease subunit, partial [Leptospirales bacterium]
LEVEYYGVTPDKIEEEITRPLEQVVSTVGGIVQIFSVSEEGKSRINIEFERDADLDLKSLEIRERVDLIASGFPREVQKPTLLRYDPDQRPVLIIVLESESQDLEELREVADREVKKAFEGIEGVSDILVAGGRIREILVDCDLQAIDAHGITLGQIMNLLQAHNVNLAVGRIDQDGGRLPVYFKGRYDGLRPIRRLTLEAPVSGGAVRLEDVARVDYAYREQDSASRLNGEERVSVYIHKSSTANLLQIADSVEAELEELRKTDLKFLVIYNQSEIIRRAVRNITLAGGAGVLLCFIALLLLGFPLRVAIFMVLAVPASLTICSFLMFLSGYDYNLVSMTGMLLSTGISILFLVLLFSIARNHRDVLAVQNLAGEIVAGVLHFAAVFTPLVFAAPEMRLIYGGLAIAILFSISAVALFGFTILPVSYAFLNRAGGVEQKAIAEVLSYAPTALVRSNLISKTTGGVYHLIHKTLPGFAFRLARSVLSDPRRWLLRYGAFVLVGFVAYQCSRQEFMNPLEERQITGRVEFPSGTSFETTNKTAQDVENRLADASGVKQITSRIEASQATLTIQLDEGVDPSEEYLDYLETTSGDLEPAFVYFDAGSGAGMTGEMSVDVLGEELPELDRITKEIAGRAAKLDGVNSMVLRYKPPRPEARIVIDRTKAESAGISPDQVGRLVRFGIQGGVATKFLERNRELDVRIRFKDIFRRDLEDLKTYGFKNNAGRYVPLPEIARIKMGEAPVKIYRKNKKRTLSFSLRFGDIDQSVLIADLENLLSGIRLPENYRTEFGKGLKDLLDTQERFSYILLFSLLLGYFVLASYSESLIRPVLISITVPPPVILVLIFLFVLDYSISIPVYIGLILLGGIITIQTMYLLKSYSAGSPAGPRSGAASSPSRSTAFLSPFRRRSSPAGGGAFLRAVRLRSQIVPVLQSNLAIFFLFLPLIFVFGEGSTLLRGIAVTILVGIASSSITTLTGTILIHALESRSEPLFRPRVLVDLARRRLAEFSPKKN